MQTCLGFLGKAYGCGGEAFVEMVVHVRGVGWEHAGASHDWAFVGEPYVNAGRGIGGGMTTDSMHVLLEHGCTMS